VGYAVDDKEVVLIDDAGRRVAHGEEGAIAVRSDYLALGYWRNPEETAHRFLAADEPGGARTYRTGDQGRFVEPGVLACLGRRDQQVKVMGNRVEVGEIKSVLREHPQVSRGAVVAKTAGDGGVLLTALIVTDGASVVDESELRRFVLSRLPPYMVPARVSVVAALPLTPNGKIDRVALQNLESEDGGGMGSPAPWRAQSPIEGRLIDIWSEILEHQNVGPSDNFFQIGGDSLKVLRIANRVEFDLGFRVPLAWFFEMTTVAEQARAIERRLECAGP
jgi:acyl-CoA synthetase (AMP-forming)/AMP-acid ligase II/acyl carrier protein